ncbi:SIR2 family protein [Nannocystis pusilla]|uniref:SIR2 family protein n=1 Tax=Nannocystis pusilla TaxID=889268 RepID=UPI003BF0E361
MTDSEPEQGLAEAAYEPPRAAPPSEWSTGGADDGRRARAAVQALTDPSGTATDADAAGEMELLLGRLEAMDLLGRRGHAAAAGERRESHETGASQAPASVVREPSPVAALVPAPSELRENIQRRSEDLFHQPMGGVLGLVAGVILSLPFCYLAGLFVINPLVTLGVVTAFAAAAWGAGKQFASRLSGTIGLREHIIEQQAVEIYRLRCEDIARTVARLRQLGLDDASASEVHERVEQQARRRLRQALASVDSPLLQQVPPESLPAEHLLPSVPALPPATPSSPTRATTPALSSSPAPTMTSTSHPPLPPLLIQAKRAGKLVPFVGAGLSLGADVKGGYPDWRSLPARLLDKCDQLGVWQSDVDREWLRLRFLRDDPLAPAGFSPRPMALRELLSGLDEVKQKLGREYRDALSTIFRPHDAAPGDAHARVKDLGALLVVTTNFDQLLEAAEPPPARQVYHWKRSSDALADIKKARRVLFKVHGSAEDAESVVLTLKEYELLQTSQEYRRVMDYLVVDHTFLFVGYGMVDPLDLDIILSESVKSLKSATSKHYALLCRLSNEQAEIDRQTKLRDEHNVQVIAYDDHQEVARFLAALARA